MAGERGNATLLLHPDRGSRVRRSRALRVVALVLAGHVALLAVRYVVTRSFVAGDSAWQFATLRSIYMQGSLDLSDEARFFYEERSAHTGNRKLLSVPEPDPRTGLVTTVWPVGAALIRLPAFAAADLCSRVASRLGFHVDKSGYRGLYQILPAVYSLAFGAAGLLLLARAMGRLAGAERALTATSTVWLATPVVYYLTIEPLIGHALSVGLACCLVAMALQLPQKAAPAWRFLALGAICGLMSITRYQDAAYFLLPVMLISERRLQAFLAITAGAAAVIAVQLVVNSRWYGSPWTTGYGAVVLPDWLAPSVWRHLFDPVQGIFTTHPIQLLGLVGLALFYRVNKPLVIALFVIFLAQLYAVAALVPAAPGMSFGNRTITSLTPAFVLGWHSLTARFPRLEPLGVALVCVNLILLALYCLRVIRDPSAPLYPL
jgi:hypothetical protein